GKSRRAAAWTAGGDRRQPNDKARELLMAQGEALAAPVAYDAPKKDLYEVGEIPPLGHVPEKMYAWCIRQERHGPPEEAMKIETVPTWEIDSHEVLVFVMAA